MSLKSLFVASGIVAGIAILAATLIGRAPSTVSADASPSGRRSFFSRFIGPRAELVVVPAGTRLPVRLQQGISSERNGSGDTFTAVLDRPLTVDGKTLAPAGTPVEGILTNVTDAGRVEGRASLTLILRRMNLNGRSYTLSTKPLTLVARSTKKKDATIIGGS
ncbi:MAG TPA: hypothetical protein VNN17_05410, partial [Terriglobia bacterium]|nr:hypothetical protein [Terriglobia bacterium]